MQQTVGWANPIILMQSIIVGLLLIVGFFVRRYIDSQAKFNDQQTVINRDLYEKHNDLSADFHEMRGEHKSNHKG